ncbi:MAG: hypothetical protein Q9210_005161 [Variospora velana]
MPLPGPPLLTACTNGDLATVCRLLGTRHDMLPECGELLGAAASKGHHEIVRFLLTNYNKQQLQVTSDHALMATYGGGLDSYRLICEREPALLDTTFAWQGSALQQTIARSNVDLSNFVLERGADPGRIITDETPRWFHNFIPIETAAICAPPDIASILLRHGASHEGTAALDQAAGHTRRMRLDMVMCLVEAGADVNATSESSQLSHGSHSWGPPLQSAIQAQNVEIVRYLLEKGASLWIYNSRGENAFYKAWEAKNEQISKILAKWRKAQES